IEVEKKIQKPKKNSVKEESEILPDSILDKEEKEEDSQIKNRKFRNISQLGIEQKETQTIVLNPEKLDLDSYYLLLKRNL
ncbi:type VI secretion protein, partial [Enterococcus faecalis]